MKEEEEGTDRWVSPAGEEETMVIHSSAPREELLSSPEVRIDGILTGDQEFASILQALRLRAGLSIRQVAERMGVSIGSVSQYLYRRRGVDGTGTVQWFLRYVAACGGDVSLTMPAKEIKTYGRPNHPALDRHRGTRIRLDAARGRTSRGHRPVLLEQPRGRTDADRLRTAVAAATGSTGSD